MAGRWFARRAPRVGAIAVVLAVMLAGVAYATIPDSGQVYTACMLKNVGTIRLIDPSLGSGKLQGHCTSAETQISWNQLGQPGAAGQAGPPGSGSRFFQATLSPNDNSATVIANLGNGVSLEGFCFGEVFDVRTYFMPDGAGTLEGASADVDAGGIASDGTAFVVRENDDASSGFVNVSRVSANTDALVANSSVGKWVRAEIHATYGNPCQVWGVITPVASA